uniref:Uncharacterized protein n=1 Tax=Rhizophora mucronata TaxID=61149 RepID=A0A2P2PL12_RHIMU
MGFMSCQICFTPYPVALWKHGAEYCFQGSVMGIF